MHGVPWSDDGSGYISITIATSTILTADHESVGTWSYDIEIQAYNTYSREIIVYYTCRLSFTPARRSSSSFGAGAYHHSMAPSVRGTQGDLLQHAKAYNPVEACLDLILPVDRDADRCVAGLGDGGGFDTQ